MAENQAFLRFEANDNDNTAENTKLECVILLGMQTFSAVIGQIGRVRQLMRRYCSVDVCRPDLAQRQNNGGWRPNLAAAFKMRNKSKLHFMFYSTRESSRSLRHAKCQWAVVSGEPSLTYTTQSHLEVIVTSVPGSFMKRCKRKCKAMYP